MKGCDRLTAKANTKIPSINLRSYLHIDLSWGNIYDRMFLGLFVVDIILRMIWLDKPSGSLIFDEWYYVNVARIILRLPQSVGSNGQPPYVNVPQGLDPNHEHLPLAKLLIALSMWIVGNNGYGWRIPSVIFGSISILAFYLLMKRVSNEPVIPILSTFLLSFDNLMFVHSRIATLDIFSLGFMLLGLYWYFSGHSYLSAVGMALSALAKETGIAGFGIIVVIQLVKFVNRRSQGASWNEFFSWFEKYVLTYGICFVLLLTIMDRYWVGYSNPLDQIRYILNYSAALTSTCPNGIISCPWQWLLNQLTIPYLKVNVQQTAGGVTTSFVSVSFDGAMNPAISFLTIPAMLYCSYNYYQRRDDLSLVSLILFAATYLPFYPGVVLGQRVTYLFYFLGAVPAVCAAIAYMIADTKLPRLVVIFYLAVVVYIFIVMFPFQRIPT
ncbi:MAG TPA: glycosyltransferase family 39 protein [archaeon]|nr:glycosyltransferase family 39 protein [archaeon]